MNHPHFDDRPKAEITTRRAARNQQAFAEATKLCRPVQMTIDDYAEALGVRLFPEGANPDYSLDGSFWVGERSLTC